MIKFSSMLLAVTVSDSFNWTKRVQRVQFMETQIQPIHWWNLSFSCGLLLLVGLFFYQLVFALVLSLIPLPGFCLPPGPFLLIHSRSSIFTLLLWISRAIYYFINTLPHKRRVCALSFPRLPSNLQLLLCVFLNACFVSRASGLCNALPSVPFQFERFVTFINALLCVLFLTSMRFVQFGSLSVSTLSHIQWCSFYAYFVSRASGWCIALPSRVPFGLNALPLGYVIITNVRVCVLRLTSIGFEQCYSLVSL